MISDSLISYELSESKQVTSLKSQLKLSKRNYVKFGIFQFSNVVYFKIMRGIGRYQMIISNFTLFDGVTMTDLLELNHLSPTFSVQMYEPCAPGPSSETFSIQ